jgi:hypothetical protein
MAGKGPSELSPLDLPGSRETMLSRNVRLDLEILAESIESGDVLEVVRNPNYPNQVIFMILLEECAVPAVPTDGGCFLKTAYHSRKLNKRFNGGE